MFVICIYGVSFVTPYFGTTEQHIFTFMLNIRILLLVEKGG